MNRGRADVAPDHRSMSSLTICGVTSGRWTACTTSTVRHGVSSQFWPVRARRTWSSPGPPTHCQTPITSHRASWESCIDSRTVARSPLARGTTRVRVASSKRGTGAPGSSTSSILNGWASGHSSFGRG